MLGFLPDVFPDAAGWLPPAALPPGCALAQDAHSSAVETVATTAAKVLRLSCFMVGFLLVVGLTHSRCSIGYKESTGV